MSEQLFMAVDLGTSFIKTGVYDLHGRCIAGASEPVHDERPAPGVFIQRGEMLYEAVVGCIQKTVVELGSRSNQLQAIAFTGQMAGAIGVGENWEDITGWSCSLDGRYLPYADRQRERLADEFFEIGGTNAPVMCSKYDWFRNEFPERDRRIRKYVMLNGYIIGKLSGIAVEDALIDHSLIAWTGMADIRTREWSAQLCGKMGIDMQRLPRITDCQTVGGYISDEAARLLSLRSGIPLIVGAGDKISGCIGAGIFSPGEMVFEASSYGAISCMVDTVRLDQKLRNYDVIGAADTDGYYAHKYIQGSGIAIDWFIRNFFLHEGEENGAGFSRAEALAAKVPAGSNNMLAIGLLGGSAMPFDSELRGLFMGHTWHHGRGHFYKALLESFSYDLALTLRSIEAQYPFCRGKTISLIGGGAKSSVWPQILADVTGHCFQRLDRDDLALWGTALLAAAGTGAASDWKALAQEHVHPTDMICPRDEQTQAYAGYIDLYAESTREFHRLYQKLNRLKENQG